MFIDELLTPALNTEVDVGIGDVDVTGTEVVPAGLEIAVN